MKIIWSRNKLEWTVEVETEKDMVDSGEVEKMMASPGWQIVAWGWAQVREKLLQNIKDISSSEVNVKLAPFKNAIFKGFEGAVDIPEQIVRSAMAKRQERAKESLLEVSTNGDGEQN